MKKNKSFQLIWVCNSDDWGKLSSSIDSALSNLAKTNFEAKINLIFKGNFPSADIFLDIKKKCKKHGVNLISSFLQNNSENVNYFLNLLTKIVCENSNVLFLTPNIVFLDNKIFDNSFFQEKLLYFASKIDFWMTNGKWLKLIIKKHLLINKTCEMNLVEFLKYLSQNACDKFTYCDSIENLQKYIKMDNGI